MGFHTQCTTRQILNSPLIVSTTIDLLFKNIPFLVPHELILLLEIQVRCERVVVEFNDLVVYWASILLVVRDTSFGIFKPNLFWILIAKITYLSAIWQLLFIWFCVLFTACQLVRVVILNENFWLLTHFHLNSLSLHFNIHYCIWQLSQLVIRIL